MAILWFNDYGLLILGLVNGRFLGFITCVIE